MNRYKELIGRINYILFLVVVVLLPFPQMALRYACVAWIVSWFLEGRWLSKPKPQQQNKIAIPFILFGLWYIWKALSGLWAADHTAWSWQMERYMTFGLLIPVGLWGVNEYYDLKQAGKMLVISCVAAVPAYLIWMLLLHAHPEWVPYLIPTGKEWVHHSNILTFFSDNISHFKHRLFLCSVELFGAIIACQLLRKRIWLLIGSLVVMLSIIPLTGSRQSLITCAVLIGIMVLLSVQQRRRVPFSVGIIAIGVILGIVMLKFHPRMQDVDVRDITEMRQLSYEHNVRFNIWGAALQHPTDYLAYGLGAGQSSSYLEEQYMDAGFTYYAQHHYNCHNQYLEELVEIGIGGLLLFIIAWISIPFCTKRKGRQTALLFTTLFILNMFTDCMFGRFCGIALWAVGMLFILLQTNTECNEESTRDT